MQLRDYFRLEAEDYLSALEQAVSSSSVELDAIRRSARGLSGVARLAGEVRILRAAAALDHVSRATSRAHAVSLSRVLREALPHFRVLVAADAPAADLDAHADAVIERCTAGQPVDALDGSVGADDEVEFREFVLIEAVGIADTLDLGIAAFLDDPQGRDALGVILRRQRSLLGSARLGEMGVVAETLRAVEDVAELIVRLDVPVKSEWLDVFRTAKDVLRVAVSNLEEGDVPHPTHSLSRLRTLREELVDRYGGKEPQPETGPVPGALAADAMNERAGRLRMDLMNAIGANARARAALEELYALAMRAGR